MEEQTIIVAALAAAASLAVKETETQEVKDSYNALKESLIRVFEKTPRVISAIQALENNPESTARKELLVGEIMELRVDDNHLSLLLAQAEAVIRLLERHGYKTSLTGSGAIAGPGAVAAGSRGVAIGGDVRGSVIITGDGNAITPPEPW